ncbi:MAG: tetratricopeptide repeat protein [Planctomycetes bacterium]|nr:tetratricopeptide repeat protein [Planctomycetota bacterium]MBI3847579.1 tetratricopeptide repeat protein [Planctomycetota bacterium]
MPIPSLLRAALLALAVLAPTVDPAADFGKGLDECQRFITQGRWRDAQTRLDALLREHEGKDYVRQKRAEIEEDMERCAFRLKFTPPDPKTLISGELQSWNPSTGDIKLRYTDRSLTDFSQENGFYVHPAKFRGPYTIEFRGVQSATALVCLDQGQAVRVDIRCDFTRCNAGLALIKDGKKQKDVVDALTVTRGKGAASLSVSVTSLEVAALCDHSRVAALSKPSTLYGRLAFSTPASEIVIKGQAEAYWLQGLVDKATSAELEQFRKTYDRTKAIPEWLRTDPKPATAAPVASTARALPGPSNPRQDSFVRSAFEMLDAKKFDEALRYVQSPASAPASDAVREYLLAIACVGLFDFQSAHHHCARVSELEPTFAGSRTLSALLLLREHRLADAVTEFQRIVAEFPHDLDAREGLAASLLRSGEPEKAKAVVDDASAASIRSSGLDDLNRLLVKAVHGPNWSKVYTYESQNFRIASDIDRATCIEASKALEESYRAYTLRLRKITDLDRRKFRVYLFAGEAGYHDYAHDLGANARHTAGLYSPAVKQLLIWNVPVRESMIRTVRHECFHQYLDRLMDEPPTWFNEGLAEYYERASIVGGQWIQGQTHPEDMQVLASPGGKLPDLSTFLGQGPEPFYGTDAPLHYAQAWALIHFLRHGPKEYQSLFDTLFDALASGASNGLALDRAFGTVNLARMQFDFEKHVRSLR